VNVHYHRTASDLLTCGHIITSEGASVLIFCRDKISAGFVKIWLNSPVCYSRQMILLTSVHRQCLSDICICVLSTWQHWISIGSLNTLCRLRVHLGSAQVPLRVREYSLVSNRIFRDWVELNWIACVNNSIQKLKRGFFGSWPPHYCACRISDKIKFKNWVFKIYSWQELKYVIWGGNYLNLLLHERGMSTL
jgi:hypothetical protein